MLPDNLRRTVISIFLYTLLVIYWDNLNELADAFYWLYLVLILSQKKIESSSHISILTVLSIVGLISNLYITNITKEAFGANVATKISLVTLLNVSSSNAHSKYFNLKKYYYYYGYKTMVKLGIFILFVFALYLFCVSHLTDIAWKMAMRVPVDYTHNLFSVSNRWEDMKWANISEITNDDLAQTLTTFIADGHRTLLIRKEYMTHKKVPSLPQHKYLIERYPGEGCRLVCDFTCNVTQFGKVHLISVSPFFTRNFEYTRYSLKYELHHSKKGIYNVMSYNLTLDISALESDDYGIYRAGLRLKVGIEPLNSVLNTSSFRLIEITESNLCFYNVSRTQEYYNYIDVPVGSMLSFNNFFIRGVPQDTYLRAEHFVNGKPFHNFTSQCCLPSLNLLGPCFNTHQDIRLNIDVVLSDKHVDVIELTASVCVCSSVYGIHRFKFFRDVYDSKHTRWTIVEFWHPATTVVYPRLLNLSQLNKYERETILNSKLEKDFSVFTGSLFQYMQGIREMEFAYMKEAEYTRLIGLICVLIVTYLTVLVKLNKAVNYLLYFGMDKLGIINQQRKEVLYLPDPGGNLANLGVCREEFSVVCNDQHYDVFVLYVEEDRDFVINELHPVFTEKQLSEFLTEEHLPVGPRLENLIKALKRSNKIIVIVSDYFVTYKLYNNYFLPNIILQRMYKGLIHPGHLMLIICKPSMIPETLLTDKTIAVMDYTRNPRDVFFRHFSEWITGSET